MANITREQCDEILISYYGNDNYQLQDYQIESASDACVGLMSHTSILKVNVIINNETNEVSFFIKSLPKNNYHIDCVTRACCFIKESAFFGDMFKDMRSFLLYKSIPECYLKNCETMIVLEDLKMSKYKNCVNIDGFNLEHCYVALKALADIHAASLLYEHKIGKTLDQILPYEILRPWFTEIDGYPGYNDNIAGAKIVKTLIDKYFSQQYSADVLNEAKRLCDHFSRNMQMSKKYRNVITHQDLWCNNVMFKYDDNDDCIVKDGIIIDFQMYGYNPPSLDALMLIYCNAGEDIRSKHLNSLLDYYYKCLSSNIEHHHVDPNSILTIEEFRASMEETLPTALTSAPLFIHTVLVPENEIIPILMDVDKFKTYMEKDRSIVLEMCEKYQDYKNRILSAITDLLNYVNGTLKI